MNRLQLLQRLHTEAAASGSSPSTVADLTGEPSRLLGGIDTAYLDIQGLHGNWDFLRNDFSKSTIVGTREYSLSALSLDELNEWYISADNQEVSLYSAASDEQFLQYLPWTQFKAQYLIGSARTVSGRPCFFSIKPDKSFIFDVLPDAIYTFTGEYFKRAQAFAATADATPLMPSQHHMSIVWRALMFYGAFEGADEVYSHGEREFNRVLSNLEFDQLPYQPILNGPVA